MISAEKREEIRSAVEELVNGLFWGWVTSTEVIKLTEAHAHRLFPAERLHFGVAFDPRARTLVVVFTEPSTIGKFSAAITLNG